MDESLEIQKAAAHLTTLLANRKDKTKEITISIQLENLMSFNKTDTYIHLLFKRSPVIGVD